MKKDYAKHLKNIYDFMSEQHSQKNDLAALIRNVVNDKKQYRLDYIFNIRV